MTLKILKTKKDYLKALAKFEEIFQAKSDTKESEEADVLAVIGIPAINLTLLLKYIKHPFFSAFMLVRDYCLSAKDYYNGRKCGLLDLVFI